MPVILRPEFERDWLKPEMLKEELADIMVPLEDGILEAHPVDKRINNTREDTNHPWIMEVCEYPELALA